MKDENEDEKIERLLNEAKIDQRNTQKNLIIESNNFNTKFIPKKRERDDKRKKIKKKRKKEKSDIEEIISYLMNEDNSQKDIKSIADYLTSKTKYKGRNAGFFRLMINTVVYNKAISISTILNKNFKYYIGKRKFELASKVFTNDRLYWQTILYEFVLSDPNKELLLSVLKFNYDSFLSLQSLNSIQSKGYSKGYINDGDHDFTLIGYELLTSEVKASLMNGDIPNNAKEGSYTIDGVEYVYYFFDNDGFLCTTKNKLKELKEYMTRYKLIKNKKKLQEGGLQVYKLENDENIYLSQNFKLIDFWPCELNFNDSIKYSYLYKFDINMMKYEEEVLKNINKQGDLKNFKLGDFLMLKNIVDFDTFETMINFVMLECISNLKDKKYKIFTDEMSKFFEEWKNIKSSFREAKRNIVNSLNIFDKFFCSFRSKIPAGYLMRLGKTVNKYLNYFNTEIGGEFAENTIFKTIAEFLKKYNLEEVACTVYNSFVNAEDIRDTLRVLSDISTNVNNATANGLLYDLENASGDIFKFYYFGDNNYYEHLINEIRTPTLFLGNLLAGNMPFAEEKLEEYEEKEDEVLKDDDKFINVVSKMNEIDDIDALKSLIILYFDRNTKNLKKKDLGRIEGNKVIFNDDMNEWFAQSNVLDELNNNKNKGKIILLGKRHMADTPDKVYFRGAVGGFFRNVLDDYKLYMESKKVNKKLNEIKKEKLLNEIKMKDANDIVNEQEDEKEDKIIEINEENIEKEPNKEIARKLKAEGVQNFARNTKGDIIINKAVLKVLKIPEITDIKGKGLSKAQFDNLTSLRKHGITDDIIKKYIDLDYNFLSKGASKDVRKKMLEETKKKHEELVVKK